MDNKILRVLGCGSRDFKEYDYVHNEQGIAEQMLAYLDKNIYTKLLQYEGYDIEIVEGCARGADTYFRGFAGRHNIACEHFAADWERFGKSAGYIRNAEIVEYLRQPDSQFTICLWDGVSKGTRSTINMCIKYNVPTYVYLYNERRWIKDRDELIKFLG